MTLYAIQCHNGLFCNAIKTIGGWLVLKKTVHLEDSVRYTEADYQEVKHLFPKHELVRIEKKKKRSLLTLF